MSMTISINKKPYGLWKTSGLLRSIDNNCGAFNFTSSSGVPRTEFPVNEGDFAEVFVNGIRKAAGYLDEVKDVHRLGSHNIICKGRDAIQDLVDSSVPDSAKASGAGPFSLKAMCQLVIDSLGSEVKVLDWLGDRIEDFTSLELMNSESAQKCMQYLVSFARKRQAYLISQITDRDIYLVIFRPFLGDRAVGSLIHKLNNPNNNILDSTMTRSMMRRYNSYLCRSQGNFSIVPLNDIDKDLEGRDEVIDPAIRESRYLEIQAEESMFQNDLLVRAKEEANLRRVNSQLYSCTVAGHTDLNGTPWDFGRFVNIEDDFTGTHGIHLIKQVEMTVDQRGDLTSLVCCPPDGYQTIPIEDPKFARLTVTGRLNKQLGFPHTVSPIPIPLKDLL